MTLIDMLRPEQRQQLRQMCCRSSESEGYDQLVIPFTRAEPAHDVEPREAVRAGQRTDDLPPRDHQKCQRQVADARFPAIVPIDFACGRCVTRSPRIPQPQCRYWIVAGHRQFHGGLVGA